MPQLDEKGRATGSEEEQGLGLRKEKFCRSHHTHTSYHQAAGGSGAIPYARDESTTSSTCRRAADVAAGGHGPVGGRQWTKVRRRYERVAFVARQAVFALLLV